MHAPLGEVIAGFQGIESGAYRYRTAIILLDALSGHAEEIVDQMTQATGGMYRFAGGGAGDDDRFLKTTFPWNGRLPGCHGRAGNPLEQAIGIGSRHGWEPTGNPLRVTETDHACVVSFDVAPAVEAFEDHAASTGQTFDHGDPMPFFLHNIVGVKTHEGHKLRVPLAIAPGGGIVNAAEIPLGTTAHIMSIPPEAAVAAAAGATRDAIDQVTREGHRRGAALFLDCVATRLRLGRAFDGELAAVSRELGDAVFAGFNSYG